MLAVRPDSVRGNVGAARVALARGRVPEARRHVEVALAQDGEDVAVQVALADVEIAEGHPDAARAALERAARRDFGQPGVHARLADLTGRAPAEVPATTGGVLARAAAHPYDPRALVDAGARLAAEGRREEAVGFLEKALWLADLDPAAAQRAARLLPTCDPEWVGRRVVPVRVYADETVRGDPYWDFRARLLWLSVSNSLDPILTTRFVVTRLTPVDTGMETPRLEPIFERFRAITWRAPPGIVAAFTERPPPAGGTMYRRGLADFMGRHLLVRLEPGETRSRVLAHEVLHLYGGIHVNPELESLMNPSGDSHKLDAGNARIARSLRTRGFSGQGLEQDVLSRVDLDEVIDSFEAAISVNLLFRRAGLDQALQAREQSRYVAAREARKATQLDPHLADVSRTLAHLMLADRRRGEALLLLDSAARLYGSDTRQGRETRAETESLRKELEREYP